jgi:zinc protease
LKLRIPALIFILAVIASSTFADSAAQVSSTVLPNGMKVIIREGHVVNLAAVDIWVRAGSVNETSANNGISHFVEHMIFKATKKYGPGQADREIEGLGAELNGGTSKDWVHFYTNVASEYLPTALDVLSDALMNAQFRPEDMDKERQVLADEIARADSNPTQRAYNLFSRAMYATHPYGLPPTGSKEIIGKLTRDDLVAYYNRYYTPANTIVSIAGDVSTSDAVALVQKSFAGFTRTSAAGSAAPPDEPPITSPCEKQFDSQTSQAYVVFGYAGPPVSQFSDACALDIILALLGDTHRGRICSALTEKGIQFGEIKTDFMSQRYPSTISTVVTVDPKDEDAVVGVLRAEYRRLADEAVLPGELEQAQRMVAGGDLFDQETFSGQARSLGLYESIASYDLSLKYASTAASITAASVGDVARKYFGTSNYCLVKVEPGKGQAK